MSAVRAACFTFVALLVTSPALAAGLTPAEREVARTLATRGFELFQSKDYPHAIESFEQAESRIHAPPHLLYIARSQAKLGKLLAAKATYERILAEKLPDGSPLPFRDAQAWGFIAAVVEGRVARSTMPAPTPTPPAAKLAIEAIRRPGLGGVLLKKRPSVAPPAPSARPPSVKETMIGTTRRPGASSIAMFTCSVAPSAFIAKVRSIGGPPAGVTTKVWRPGSAG